MCDKKTCEECGRILRTKCFIFNPIKKKKICKRCSKRIGTNKFYVPEIKGEKKIFNRYHNYNLTENERQALFKDLVNLGMPEYQARLRVNNRCRYIRWFQRSNFRVQKNKDEGDKDIMKNLLNGLKQAR